MKKKTENKNPMVFYAAIIAALVVLGWVFLSSFQKSGPAPVNSANNYAPGLATGNDNCGNLTDLANVQHLSHHPGTFADCIKKVDPVVFKQAVGMDKDAYMSKNGIK